MNLRQLFEDDFWDVDICWSRPKLYENVIEYGADLDDEAYLYMITAKFSSYKPKIIYIGKTYKQTVSLRLSQDDHSKRYKKLRKQYPRHKFYVSYGTVHVHDGQITENRIKDIEKILIYSNDTDHVQNVSNYYTHGVKNSYKIKLTGYRHTLSKELYLGVFVK